MQSALPKTAAEKTTLAGAISVVLASLAGLVFWNRRK
ncbi:LPXTG cell wall anchor domain-containing protein [Weissella kandleri]